ncbi:glycoside hydrolase family 13 protein [Monashia sp. NPDC004114]
MYSTSRITLSPSGVVGAPVRAQAPGPDRGWWRQAVTYQVYVRSFQDSDGDGVGDLDGVRSRLPYLRELGVDAIWISPFYPSPQHDHGYDVADYMNVNPELGTLEGFDALLRDAHRLDLKVITDMVPNHCSVDHPWFTAAVAAGPGSRERQRFHFADGRGGHGELPPNNWCSIFGGPAWQRATEPDGTEGQWYLHTFAPEQADFNWIHPDVNDYFDEVIRFWFDRGVDGLRIDVAHGLHKGKGLPDHDLAPMDELTGDPVNPYAWNQPEVHDVWRRWRQIAEEYTDTTGRERVLIGEVGVLDAAQLADYQRPDELHQSFFFDFLRTPWDVGDLRDSIERGLRAVSAHGSPVAWVLNNHDMPRVVTRYAGGAPGGDAGDVDLGTARARAAALLMLAMPGSTFLYQGEELGLPEVTDLPDDVLTDPMFHRTGGARRGRDGCRVPLPWTSSPADSFGFSPADPTAGGRAPWLPQPAWFEYYSVDNQLGSDESMLQLYREAIALRRRLAAPSFSEFRWLPAEPGVLAFARGDGFACVVNCSSRLVRTPVDGQLLLASDPETGEKLPPNSAAWFELTRAPLDDV